ncbi:thiamine pyrophosphate-dependent enzyme [Granulicella arctica]|uniref:TPP-dependent pyruvate/acetoin dehydrogenase alpha subunit n=1 Tax=Granulicella arctica TaxID=940613 RepID=A0A7Y9PJ66_9BACT|nr:thiamine pyrophosphate-dependent enzyme [Granulicella arctica]NYF80888.1 TPP-dependent pyruvate/acetoin dehydrogenase alpha subunit [Granulicella arctica]
MGEMAGRVVGESPLVPNRKMQRMYEGMVESRLLEELVAERRKKAKGPAARGQEACRVSALLDLEPDDLISDVDGGVTTAFLRGAELHRLVKHTVSKKKDRAALTTDGLLPEVAETGDRFQMALGSALTLKRLKLRKVVVVFAERDALKPSEWRETLRFAAREELPMLFVALAGKEGKGHRAFELSERATEVGVPGIPVDVSDAVALYRVAQESIGRARVGGGPALMECVRLAVAGKHVDPIDAMRQTLLSRKVCGEEWMDGVAPAFRARLDAL